MTSPFRKSFSKRPSEVDTPVRQRRRLYDGRTLDPDGMLSASASPGPKPFTPGRLRISFNKNRYDTDMNSSRLTKLAALFNKPVDQAEDEEEEEEELERITVLDDSSDNEHTINRSTGIEWEREHHTSYSRVNASDSIISLPFIGSSSHHIEHTTSYSLENNIHSTKLISKEPFMNEFDSAFTPAYQQSNSLEGIEDMLPFSMMYKQESSTPSHGPDKEPVSTSSKHQAPPVTNTTTTTTAAASISNMPTRLEMREADVQSTQVMPCTSAISSSPQQPACNSTDHLGLNDNSTSLESIQFLTEWQSTIRSSLERLSQLIVTNQQFIDSITEELGQHRNSLAEEQSALLNKWNVARGAVIQLKMRTECDLVE